MTNVTKRALAACVGTIALACTVIQPANAADIPATPYYGGPPVQEDYGYQPPVQQNYGYQQRPRVYQQEAAPPVYYEQAPPAVVVVPEPYYVPPRRVYVDPGYSGYGAYGYPPPVARGYGYHRGGHHHHHQHDRGYRRW
jgi:hypothetical protein